MPAGGSNRPSNSGRVGESRRKLRFRAEMRLIRAVPAGICGGVPIAHSTGSAMLFANRREFVSSAFLAGVGLAFAPSAALAQQPDAPFRYVDPLKLSLDRGGVWTLNFAYLPPRIATVKVPGKGERVVWYIDRKSVV